MIRLEVGSQPRFLKKKILAIVSKKKEKEKQVKCGFREKRPSEYPVKPGKKNKKNKRREKEREKKKPNDLLNSVRSFSFSFIFLFVFVFFLFLFFFWWGGVSFSFVSSAGNKTAVAEAPPTYITFN